MQPGGFSPGHAPPHEGPSTTHLGSGRQPPGPAEAGGRRGAGSASVCRQCPWPTGWERKAHWRGSLVLHLDWRDPTVRRAPRPQPLQWASPCQPGGL